MPSDDTTVATQADFVPMAVGNTDRVRSVVSASAHDGFSHHLRSGMQQGQLSVLCEHTHVPIGFSPKYLTCALSEPPTGGRGERGHSRQNIFITTLGSSRWV